MATLVCKTQSGPPVWTLSGLAALGQSFRLNRPKAHALCLMQSHASLSFPGILCFPALLIHCSIQEFNGHYRDFCKQVLWKPFHYQLQDNPKAFLFEEGAWKNYFAVNALFAAKIVESHHPVSPLVQAKPLPLPGRYDLDK